MATKTNKIDPEARYRVKVNRVIRLANGVLLKPRNGNFVKGKILSTILSDVAQYEAV